MKVMKISKLLSIFISGFMLFAAVSSAVCLTGCGRKVKDGGEDKVDLREWFKLTEHMEDGKLIAGAADNEFAVTVDGKVLNGRAVLSGEYIYMDTEDVSDFINARFYLDYKEGISLYALPDRLITWVTGTRKYSVGGEESEYKADIAIYVANRVYINLDFVREYTDMDFRVINDGAKRVAAETFSGDTEVITIAKKVKLRDEQSTSGRIITIFEEGEVLYLISSNEEKTWYEVVSKDGFRGYIQAGDGNVTVTKISREYKSYDYKSLKYDYPICLGWHQMEYEKGNDNLKNIVKGAEPLNVISPTWFKLSDTSGNIDSLASERYVKSAHDMNIKVWALINDFNRTDSGTYIVDEVLPYTSKRRKLTAAIMRELKQCGADGINVDFEHINANTAKDYLQFLRELSIECRREGIVLSTDNYVPTGSNAYYNRKAQGEIVDYFIIMGYDEHWAGCGEAGSVASKSFVEDGITNTLKSVPADKVINAVPFYTRIWIETPEDLTDGTQTIIEDPIYGNYALSSRAVGMKTASDLLDKNGVKPVWLGETGQFYGEYLENRERHRIWLEEEESMKIRLDYIKQYSIAGVACWKLGLEDVGIWKLFEAYFGVRGK